MSTVDDYQQEQWRKEVALMAHLDLPLRVRFVIRVGSGGSVKQTLTTY